MKKNNILRQVKLISLIVLLSSTMTCIAQNSTAVKSDDGIQTIKHGKYTLVFESKSPSFSKETSQTLIDTYFKVYPKLVRTYNKKSARLVKFVIDPGYDGVAATSNARVVFNPTYMTAHPKDIDVVTHEVMHIVQAYGGRNGMPGWLSEGIADYVRSVYGVDNPGAGWTMPKYTEKQSYKNSYRITARFLVWLEANGQKGIVKKLDQAGRDKTYDNGALWTKLTGKTIDELWKDYAQNPTL
jgi:hypothetical protein